MPIKPFRDLFLNMQQNEKLTIKELHFKAITLFSFTLMASPSDFAQREGCYIGCY